MLFFFWMIYKEMDFIDGEGLGDGENNKSQCSITSCRTCFGTPQDKQIAWCILCKWGAKTSSA